MRRLLPNAIRLRHRTQKSSSQASGWAKPPIAAVPAAATYALVASRSVSRTMTQPYLIFNPHLAGPTWLCAFCPAAVAAFVAACPAVTASPPPKPALSHLAWFWIGSPLASAAFLAAWAAWSGLE